MGQFIDLTGERFGRWVVIERDGTSKSGHVTWLCKCDCGTISVRSSNHLRSGSKSCGCLQRERASEANLTKAPRRKKREPLPQDLKRLHRTYYDMIKRCENQNNNRYAIYGGRGIKICNEWKSSFLDFAVWAVNNGYDDNLTLDRKDTNGDYCPENCRWSTAKVQNNNRRNNRIVEYKGQTMTAHELSDLCDIEYRTLWARLKAGWSVEDAAERPVRRSIDGHYVV